MIAKPNEEFLNLIKMIALDTVKASKPCNVRVGIVESVEPLEIRIGNKARYDMDFLTITKRIRDMLQAEELKRGDRVMLFQESGGQNFFVVDKVV